MPAIPFIPAIIGGAASLGGALINRNAANNAQEAQQQATDQNLALQRDVYNQQRADMAPYRNVGSGAIGTLGALMGLPGGAPTDIPPPSTFPGGGGLTPAPGTTPWEPFLTDAGRERWAERGGTLRDLATQGQAHARTQSSLMPDARSR